MAYLYLKTSSPTKSPPKSHKFIAAILFGFGLFLFGSALFPIVQYQLEYSAKFGQVLSPLSTKFYNQEGYLLANASNTDYTQLDNWFTPTASNAAAPPADQMIPTGATYNLAIPKLKIDTAEVIVGSMDLKKSLIHYQNTALPGQLGNGVIFGHSVLPQFFNPKSYLTIFSTLYRLKEGDEIYVSYDNIRYRYLVVDMYEVQPTDLSVLEQRYDGKYLTLVTCTPPGTYLRRLVIKAKISTI